MISPSFVDSVCVSAAFLRPLPACPPRSAIPDIHAGASTPGVEEAVLAFSNGSVIDVLRKGIKHGPVSVDLFHGKPTPGNTKAEELFRANVFSVTRQLRYSKDETQLALDLGLFLNGLPVATGEVKNQLTKRTVHDAIQQYKRDRSAKELLFQFGRCAVHFAIDEFKKHRKNGGQIENQEEESVADRGRH